MCAEHLRSNSSTFNSNKTQEITTDLKLSTAISQAVNLHSPSPLIPDSCVRQIKTPKFGIITMIGFCQTMKLITTEMKSSDILRMFLYGMGCIAVLLCNTSMAQRSGRDPSSYPQRRYGAEAVDCQSVSEIAFVSFFPCFRNENFTLTSEKLSECDLLAEAAAHLAVERVNQDPHILPNITLKLHPVYTPNSKELITVSCGLSLQAIAMY